MKADLFQESSSFRDVFYTSVSLSSFADNPLIVAEVIINIRKLVTKSHHFSFKNKQNYESNKPYVFPTFPVISKLLDVEENVEQAFYCPVRNFFSFLYVFLVVMVFEVMREIMTTVGANDGNGYDVF
jgi:hypothetical protein